MPHVFIDPKEVLDAASSLIRVPSVNPAIAPSEAHGEAAVAAVARDWLTAHGVNAWLEEAAPGRSNAVAEIGSGAPTLVFCAHLDTVGTDGMTIAPFEPRVERGRLFGRGSYDMKGSAGACMAAAAALARNNARGHLLLALVADEEHASIGASDFVSRHTADACVVTEPSEGQLVLAHKGFAWIDIVTRGRAAHGSRWDLGLSAIARMGRVIAALDEFDSGELRRRTHPLVGPASMHPGLVSGGTGLSTYASECRLQVERRMLPGERVDEVVREIREAIAAAGEEAEVSVIFSRPGLVCDPQQQIVRAVQSAATDALGHAPAEIGVAYWMDAAIFAAAGIPTVNFGPAGEGAHAAVEWVDVESLVTTARVLAGTALRFFA
jgi:acetylornithine deacetylase